MICSPKHRKLARQAAVESIVLLKNRGKILPLRADIKRISIVGPTATSVETLLGNYNGYNESLTTLMEGIVGRAPEGVRVGYRMGVPLHEASLNPLDWTTGDAVASDVAIACMGYSPLLESEEGDAILSVDKGDRSQITLPSAQVDFVKKLVIGGAKVILVLCGGSAIALGELEDMVEAVVFVWYPGEAGGKALADVLFGDVSPSGKLPVTFPRSLEQLPDFADYSMAKRTYRYSAEDPLYPFGFGLSYSRFEYKNLKVRKDQVRMGKPVELSVELKNAGEREAAEVVQVYLSDLQASALVPIHKLVGFKRVMLKAGQTRIVKFSLPAEAMMFVGEDGQPRLEAGQFRLTVGGCSPGKRGVELGAPEPLSVMFTLVD